MNTHLHIVLLGTAYPFRGGLAAYNERLVKEFIHTNDKARIETFTLQYPAFLFPGKTQLADWEKPAEIEIHTTVNSINPINWVKVGRKLKKEKPDILIIKYWLPFMAPCFGTIARIAKSNHHTKVICIADNMIPHENRLGDKWLTRYFTPVVDGYIAMSKSVMDDIHYLAPSKPVNLSPHPVFDNFGESVSRKDALNHLQLSEDNNYLLFFGFIRDYKGLDLLLEAFSIIKREEYHLKLIVAGEFYSDAEKYLKIIKDKNIAVDVILKTDFIPDNEVKFYFGASDLVVQPYKTATQSGITQIAYHFQKPMVVTNVGGLSEIVPNNKAGFVVEPNPEAIAQGIISFFNNKTIDFNANLVEEKKKYSWQTMVKNIKDVYQKILSK